MRSPLLLTTAAAIMLSSSFLQGGTDLSRAAVDGNLTIAKERVKAGEKVNEIDRWGWTALGWAAYYGNEEVAVWLLENGADPNAKTTYKYGSYPSGVTPLILAAYYGHDGILKQMLEHKGDPTMVDSKGKTALDYAKQFNFERCVTILSQ